jgi:hypothetical protein
MLCFLRRFFPLFLPLVNYFHSPAVGDIQDKFKFSVSGFITLLSSIRTMTGSPPRTTCRMLFCKLEILTTISRYILSSMRFLSSNLEIFTFNSSIHTTNTRHRLKLHKPLVRLKLYQQSPYYNCVNIYNKFPDDLAKSISNKEQFLKQLKQYLIDKPFYTMEEIFEH